MEIALSKGKQKRVPHLNVIDAKIDQVRGQSKYIPSLTAGKIPAIAPSCVSVSMRYYDHKYECLSVWVTRELKALSGLIDQLRSYTWHELTKTGGTAGNKTGPGCTKINPSQLPSFRWSSEVSPDISYYELRVTQKARVFGFQIDSIFFLVWLDRNHSLCK